MLVVKTKWLTIELDLARLILLVATLKTLFV
jgi:hypothetical protein